jgi:hypothetical protein
MSDSRDRRARLGLHARLVLLQIDWPLPTVEKSKFY